MAIPTEAEFIESMQALASPLPDSLIMRFDKNVFLADDTAPAMALAEELDNWDRQQLDEAMELKAAHWLGADRMINKAYETARKRVQGVGPDASKALLFKRLQHFAGGTVSSLRWNHVQPIRDSHYKFARVWILALLRAFHEYHFKPDTVAQSIHAEKTLQTIRKQAIEGAEALKALQMHLLPLSYRSSSAFAPTKEKINSHFEADLRRINRLFDEGLRAIQPIKRNDATSKERILVYRLWEAHSAIFKHPKPRAIQIILLAEGVKNQIDERSVEKMCAAFNAQRTIRVNNIYPRTLFAEIRGEKYRDEMRAKYDESEQGELLATLGPQLPLAKAV